jgi:hypothetical protein
MVRNAATADGQRHEPAFQELQRARNEERAIDRRQRTPHERDLRRAPLPVTPRDREHGDRRDQHHTGHRETVGGGQRRRRAEREHQCDAADVQSPIDKWNVDLSGMSLMSVPDEKAREQAEPDRLPGE